METKKKWALFVFISILIGFWVNEINIKSPTWIFMLVQTVLSVLVSLYLVMRFKAWHMFFIAFISGWFVSFLTSFTLDFFYSENTLIAIIDQFEKGVLFEKTFFWFVISGIYLGNFQMMLFSYLFCENDFVVNNRHFSS